MNQPDGLNRLSTALSAALERRKENGKKYSVYKLAKRAGVDYGYTYRIVCNNAVPSRDILIKICEALDCTREESIEIFHAADYLSPEEKTEEAYSAA